MPQAVSLDDKYALESGRAFMSGVQALVRLPLMQAARDRAAGLKTAGFISGYRGSPLGTYDDALGKARSFLAAAGVRFQPGINEDLAATSLWGTQQVALLPERTVEGVFGIWYGKGPGVDRSADVFKHANAAGTSPHGGVLAVMGDDHGCQSSTLPHQSEQIMAAAMIPVLNPASVQDHLDLGLMGFALSRFSGCWVGLKATTEVIEASAVVDIDPMRLDIVLPTDLVPQPAGLGIRWPDTPLDQERRLHGPKMDAVLAFARANALDKPIWRRPDARLGIVATGKAYMDVRQALDDLGIGEREAAELGLALFKVAMPWPLEPSAVGRFAAGLSAVLVVEEKRGLIEDQLALQLYNATVRPIMVGKRDEQGRTLFPSAGELDPVTIAAAIVSRLEALGGPLPALRSRVEALEAARRVETSRSRLSRTPFFCSGCPHNTSTNVPEGSRAMAGIGCHGMAYSIPERRTTFITQMGGEGATWIGQASYTAEPHVFQNLGDGTYMHSGLLAIRAAAAAGVNITYKILYNDAVAMTGGQAHDGELTVPLITRQVAAEGARRIVVVTDEPEKYRDPVGLAPGAEVRHRDDLDAIQRELREVPGLSVLVYDQTCAAEKRRRRKRGLYPDPPKRAFINDLVCEGCGDCSVKSNCISVKPLETPLGRKRRIDQSDCNKDFSCVKGFCPSFVTVHGGTLRRTKAVAGTQVADPFAGLPTPARPALSDPYNILITGIGGTGVITIGALLGMAARIEGLGATVLDFTGLAQKNGGVMSHVRIAPRQDDLHAVRIGAGAADLLLGCDLVVAAGEAALSRFDPVRTAAVVNARVSPTSAFVRDGAMDLSTTIDREAVQVAVRSDAAMIDAGGLAIALLGDSIATNLFMLGYAWQKGQVPLGFEALDRAIELNGVAVAANRKAFAWGRAAAHDMTTVEAVVVSPVEAGPAAFDLTAFVGERSRDLVDYQNEAYAVRYRSLVERAALAETAVSGATGELTEAVARYFYKLMAYKDEYEVARLYTDGRFAARLAAQFEGDYRLEFNLAPPLFAGHDPSTGELRKRAYGAWMFAGFKLLARLKGLRGGALDIFGYQNERRIERGLIDSYERTVDAMLQDLSSDTLPTAVALARLPDEIRGYGHVKMANLATAEAKRAGLLARLDRRAEAQLIEAAE
ncbi:MAG: indolepyruvate ferredoxin oxidoreductase family protein [Caulobacter sp.]|nr:indolepyruvate ferredoxin oxidoreductase family protein [Caulobacter sp.]